MKKKIIIQIICAIGLIPTTWYLANRLEGLEILSWGLWGLFIFIGSIINNDKETNSRT